MTWRHAKPLVAGLAPCQPDMRIWQLWCLANSCTIVSNLKLRTLARYFSGRSGGFGSGGLRPSWSNLRRTQNTKLNQWLNPLKFELFEALITHQLLDSWERGRDLCMCSCHKMVRRRGGSRPTGLAPEVQQFVNLPLSKVAIITMNSQPMFACHKAAVCHKCILYTSVGMHLTNAFYRLALFKAVFSVFGANQ